MRYDTEVQAVVTAAFAAPRTLEQHGGELAAVDLRLDDATLARLREVFPCVPLPVLRSESALLLRLRAV